MSRKRRPAMPGLEHRRTILLPPNFDIGPAFRPSPPGKHRALDGSDTQNGITVPVPPSGTLNAPLEVPLFLVKGSPQFGEILTVTFSQVGTGKPASGFTPGPCIGILEFGNAGGGTRVEVDIPAPRQTPNPPSVVQLPLYGGVSISIPAATVNVKARNDANTQALADPTAQPIGTELTNPAQVAAWISYGSKAVTANQGDITRTIVLNTINMAGGWNPGDPGAFIGIPPFARRFWITRSPLTTTALAVEVDSVSTSNSRTIVVGLNNEGPFELFAQEDSMVVTVTAGSIVGSQIIFELEL